MTVPGGEWAEDKQFNAANAMFAQRYNEPFRVTGPETVVISGTHTDWRHARQGLCWTIGKGRDFCSAMDMKAIPIFFLQPQVQKSDQRRAVAGTSISEQLTR